jgi:hypothetical protein
MGVLGYLFDDIDTVDIGFAYLPVEASQVYRSIFISIYRPVKCLYAFEYEISQISVELNYLVAIGSLKFLDIVDHILDIFRGGGDICRLFGQGGKLFMQEWVSPAGIGGGDISVYLSLYASDIVV